MARSSHLNQKLIEAEISKINFAGGGSTVNTEGMVIKTILSSETIFYVRNDMPLGNDGATESTAFASVEEALIILAGNYEISGHLIIDLDTAHTLRAVEFPSFTGSGKITIRSSGAKTSLTFNSYASSTEAAIANWGGLDITLENLTFIKNQSTKFIIQGGKFTFENVDFTDCEIEFDNCRSSYLNNCSNSNRIRFYRSVLFLTSCRFTCEFFYSQIETVNCTFVRTFIIEASNALLRNPRFDSQWYTQTAKIVNSTIEFKASWLTFLNLGGNPQTRDLIQFVNCNLKDFPSNVDVQGTRSFYEASILKFVNCLTPEEFNNVNYNFSQHSFIKDAYAIELVNSAFLKAFNVTGAEIYRDPFSVLGGVNYDNSQTGIPANTLQEAIDYLFSSIVQPSDIAISIEELNSDD